MKVPNVRNLFQFLLFILLIVVCLYLHKSCYSFNNVDLVITTEPQNFNSSNTTIFIKKYYTKFILYWTPFWDRDDYYIGTGYNPFKNCKYKNCYATSNKSYIPVEQFDALIFHGHLEKSEIVEPRIRRKNQMYIFMNMEAPVNVMTNLKAYHSFFNWTMSYRFDSDLPHRHGELNKRKRKYVPLTKLQLADKSKLAAWFVSHCKTLSKREVLVEEIQKYMPVDIYGKCSKLQCENHKKCYDMIEKNYKFYFSFENAYCKDYSTEKVYRILERNIIPVVYSGSDCNVTVPPYSVINVRNYETVKDLVDYLIYLDKNDDKYLEYFKWKENYFIGESKINCRICTKLNEPIKQSIYKDVDIWWRGVNKSYCKTKKLLPKIVSDLLK